MSLFPKKFHRQKIQVVCKSCLFVERRTASKFIKLSVFLSELRESEKPLRQTELCERTNKSKSTTHRNIRTLEEEGAIRKRGSGYELTKFGSVVAKSTSIYLSEIETAERYREFLEIIADTALRLEDIKEGDVTRTSRNNPVAPLVRLAEVTVNAEEIRVLTNSIAPESFEVGRRGIREGKKTVEMVVDRRTIESIRGSEWFGEELEKDLRTGNFDLWVHNDPVPYQIAVMDGRLCLGAEDEDRMPVAVLETKNEDAVGCARQIFEEFRNRSEKLTPANL